MTYGICGKLPAHKDEQAPMPIKVRGRKPSRGTRTAFPCERRVAGENTVPAASIETSEGAISRKWAWDAIRRL
jgi:hypothetical protein